MQLSTVFSCIISFPLTRILLSQSVQVCRRRRFKSSKFQFRPGLHIHSWRKETVAVMNSIRRELVRNIPLGRFRLAFLRGYANGHSETDTTTHFGFRTVPSSKKEELGTCLPMTILIELWGAYSPQ